MSASRAARTRPQIVRIPGLSSLPFIPMALVLYALARLVSFAILNVVAHQQVPSGMSGGDDKPLDYLGFMAMWDGQWYQRIAEHGYPSVLPVDATGRVEQNPWAFYPIFPMLSRALMTLTGWSFNAAGMTVALVCGFLAAVLIAVLLRELLGAGAALVTVLLWACFPASPVLQVAYTESLAVLLLVAYLMALRRERWLLATGLAVLTGLARPIAVPLGLVTLVAVWLRWRRRAQDPVDLRLAAKMLAALAGCGVAGLIWPTTAWAVTGSRSAYTDTMASWRAYDSVQPFVPWLDKARWLLGETRGPILLGVLVIGLLALVLGPWAKGLGPELRAWSLAYPAYLGAVLDPFTSLFRYLIPLFPLSAVVVGVAWTTRRVRSRTVCALLVPLVVLSVIGQWYWTSILYQFTPPSDYPP